MASGWRWRSDDRLAAAAMEAIEFFDGEAMVPGRAPLAYLRAAMEAIEFFDGELSWAILGRLVAPCRNGGHRVLRWRAESATGRLEAVGSPQWRPSSSSMASTPRI